MHTDSKDMLFLIKFSNNKECFLIKKKNKRMIKGRYILLRISGTLKKMTYWINKI